MPRFTENFATVAKPLRELTKKYARFNWTEECQEAFDELKQHLRTAPVLGYPLDSGEMLLDTDASDWEIGAVLSQVQGGEKRVLAFGSRWLTATEQNYCTTRRELLTAIEFTYHFRQYLLGRAFTLWTDHSSLRWLTRFKEPEGQLARWLEKLAEYNFPVVHRPGRPHQNVDALSRRPCRESCPCTVPEPMLNSDQQKGVHYDTDGSKHVAASVTTNNSLWFGPKFLTNTKEIHYGLISTKKKFHLDIINSFVSSLVCSLFCYDYILIYTVGLQAHAYATSPAFVFARVDPLVFNVCIPESLCPLSDRHWVWTKSVCLFSWPLNWEWPLWPETDCRNAEVTRLWPHCFLSLRRRSHFPPAWNFLFSL